jgi:hypothetical protein
VMILERLVMRIRPRINVKESITGRCNCVQKVRRITILGK